jgi:uncharacterized protein (DUF1800 family)
LIIAYQYACGCILSIQNHTVTERFAGFQLAKMRVYSFCKFAKMLFGSRGGGVTVAEIL